VGHCPAVYREGEASRGGGKALLNGHSMNEEEEGREEGEWEGRDPFLPELRYGPTRESLGCAWFRPRLTMSHPFFLVWLIPLA